MERTYQPDICLLTFSVPLLDIINALQISWMGIVRATSSEYTKVQANAQPMELEPRPKRGRMQTAQGWDKISFN